MAQAKLRLLLLSVGSLVAHSVIDALGARRERCVLIGANSIAEAAGNFRCDIAYLVPPAASGGAYIDRIAGLIDEERPDLVIPCRDDDILALAMLGEQAPRAHSVLLTGSVASARIMNDKEETARFAARHELPFAPTATDARQAVALAKAYGLPLIGKPRSGNAAIGVVLLRSEEEIERAFASRADLVAQPFLDPRADMPALTAPHDAGLPFFFSFPEPRIYAIEVVVGPDRAISKVFGRVSVQVAGQGVETARCDDPELIEAGRAYARATATEGWKGPLNVQFKRTPRDGFVAFELNGRFAGGTGAHALMGFDQVAEVISRFLPGTAFPTLDAFECDLVQRYLCSCPVPREGPVALQTAGRWSRSAA